MDLIDFNAARFEAIRQDYEAVRGPSRLCLDYAPSPSLPSNGDNIIEPSATTPWYAGPTLLSYLETVQVADDSREQPFRLPVQWVNRPHLDFRGFCGTIASGSIRPGDEVAGQLFRAEPAGWPGLSPWMATCRRRLPARR